MVGRRTGIEEQALLRISRTFVRFAAAPPTDEDIRRIGSFAYETAEVSGAEYLAEVDPGTEIEVAEGSVEVAAMILAAAPILYAAITGYDSFWSGVERLTNHARKAGNFVKGKLASSRVPVYGSVVRTRVSVGHLATLERLHRDVHQRQRSPDQAVQAALRTLRRAGEPIDESLIESLEHAFRAPPRGSERIIEADEELVRREGGLPASGRAEHALGPRPKRRRLKMLRHPGSKEVEVQLEHDE